MNKTVLFLVFWITIPFLMFAQTSQHFQYEQALISNNTRCISQNIDGSEIWVGTTEGVSVYNGTNWTNYTTNDNLPHNLIYDIHCASNGDMWVATGSGIAKFDNGNWTAYTMGDGLPASAIWSITEDTDGNIWGGTSNSGIFKYNGNTFYTYSTQNGLIDNSVKSIYGDKYGYIWVGTGAGLSRYDGNTFKNYNNTNGLGGNLVNDILQLSNGSIAVATNGGLSIFNFASWQTLNTSDGLPNNNVLSIAENDANVLYIGCANGLFEYENSTTYSLYNIDDGLAETIVSSVLVDKTGSVWAGAPFSGISRYHKNNKTVIFQENTTIASNNIKHIYKDNNAAIWISTDNGLNSYENNQWRTYKTAYGIA
ncbi:MAG: hypothetical protein GX879_06455, partial [Bacteroidales bacterium]|nr:hypothetical protein [Bacteroidales bacterium]